MKMKLIEVNEIKLKFEFAKKLINESKCIEMDK